MRRGSRSISWLRRILVVASLLVLVFVPSLDTSERQSDTARITDYSAHFDLSEDGDLHSVETIGVEMPSGKRGIFKIFDTADPRRPVEHPVTIHGVTRDGEVEPFTSVDSAEGTETIRIGDAGVYLDPGTHLYTIESSTVDVFERGTGDLDGLTVWWWDVVGAGWQMPIGSSEVTATLPAEPVSVECIMGEDTPCRAQVDGTTLRVTTESLAPFTPVTLRVAFDPNDVAPPPADMSWLVLLIASIVAGAIGVGLGLWASSTVREPDPGFPVLFEPPFLVPPALGVRVLDEEDSSHALQATLFDLAERGVLRLAGNDSSWVIETQGAIETATLHPIEASLLRTLGIDRPGATFVAEKSVSSGERISSANSTLRAATAAAARPYLAGSAGGTLANLGTFLATAIVIGAAVAKVFASFRLPWPLVIGAAGFALVASGEVTSAGARTKRTAQGRDLWSRTGGFARFLSTDSSEARFDAAAHLDWYPRYLSWAVALGVADRWAAKYSEQGVTLPEVPWLLWAGTGRLSAGNITAMTNSFDSAISSASAAYSASQAASAASSGGGFSGGSGGGGGGGGSW